MTSTTSEGNTDERCFAADFFLLLPTAVLTPHLPVFLAALSRANKISR
jgi:hypothetical protein